MKPQIIFFKNSIQLMALFILCFAHAQTTTIFSNHTDITIPDDATFVYSTIMVSGIPEDAHIYNMNMLLRADHTFVGDLTMDLQLPNYQVMGLMHRPGTAAVSGAPYGNPANLSSEYGWYFTDYTATLSEDMGAGLLTDDIIPSGNFYPTWNNEAITHPFSSFTQIAQEYTGPKNGEWRMYTRDMTGGDTGTLTYVDLYMAYDMYCVPFFGNNFEHITNVSFSSLNYTSDEVQVSYPDYQTVDATGNSYPVTQGETYPLSVSIAPDINDYIYAFIDWNQDKDFDDAGETYTVASAVSTAGPHTLNITIPEGATLGQTRMRVMLSYEDPTPNPCESIGGEVEDFTLLVEENMGVEDALANHKTTAYPNPVVDVVNFTSKNNIEQINIYNVNGQEVFAQKANSKQTELNISNLPSGIYVAKIKTDKGTETIKLIKK